jgi:Na+/H+ antiporter NhaC
VVLLLGQKACDVHELERIGPGAGGLVPLALILLLALALGDVANALGTGRWVAQVTRGALPPVVVLPLVLLVAAGIAFRTDTQLPHALLAAAAATVGCLALGATL